ncbi:MAG: MBL fold metallo-hydrolase [Solirubrobacterales bacterium]
MLQKLDPHLVMAFTESGFSHGNSLLIEDDVRLLIDTGATDIIPSIQPETIDIVLNSHYHIDHIRGNDLCGNAKVYLHALDAAYLQNPKRLSAIDEWEELMTINPLEGQPSVKKIAPNDVIKPYRVDGTFQDGDQYDCGHTKLTVLHTPGHCAGHCAFFFPDSGTAFLGDICLTKVGPWYGEADADIDAFIQSINRMIALKPDRVVTGHVGQIITENIPEVLTEYRDRILKREERIYQSLKTKAVNIHELADQHLIYRMHPSSFVLYWEKYMLKKHLARLEQQGRAERNEENLFRAV